MCRFARRRAMLVAALLVATACGVPVGVKRVDPQTVSRSLTRNVLTAGRPSQFTKNVLYERALVGPFEKDPERALAELRAAALRDERPDDMFALAELSFLYANDTRDGAHYLAAAVYAWAYLFPEGTQPPPSPFDPRFRVACDLYNRGITEGFASTDGSSVELRDGTYRLPFGTLTVTVDPADLTWAGRTFTRFVPVAEMEVYGLPTRFRWPGLGAPLAARTTRIPGKADEFVAPHIAVPVTALLRLEGARKALVTGDLRGHLDVYTASGPDHVDLEGRTVPLETESTATLAYMLSESAVWKREIAGFLSSISGIHVKSQLRALVPYRRGRIPVVFVHGTASSAGRWAEMLNELENDPRLRDRYQFWFFSYDTGNPILYSAMLLRDALTERVAELDPDGTDAALRRMVVIGHSQGGLLTKMTVVESGDAFWANVSRRPFTEVTMSDETRALVRRAAFVEPLPFVHRVIFIATPHRGSYVAGSWLAQQVARFVTMPATIAHTFTDIFRDAPPEALSGQRIPTAVDNMTPGNPFVRTLSSLPIAPGVRAHSIIATKRPGPPQGQNDGVVEYDSAHIGGVESEVVVESGHSCQDNAVTIGEVRRILLENLRDGSS